MYRWSSTSQRHRSGCHIPLQQLFDEVLKEVDCRYECGHRNKEEQNRLYTATPQLTKVTWPHSKHNFYPSLAADVMPYPVVWPKIEDGIEKYSLDLGRIYMFVGYVKGIAYELGINIRAGADWDSDFQISDQKFHDLPHFELVGHF